MGMSILLSTISSAIWGSDKKERFVKGPLRAACFMDVPFDSRKYILHEENSSPNDPRYEAFGVFVTKKHAYQEGLSPSRSEWKRGLVANSGYLLCEISIQITAARASSLAPTQPQSRNADRLRTRLRRIYGVPVDCSRSSWADTSTTLPSRHM